MYPILVHPRHTIALMIVLYFTVVTIASRGFASCPGWKHSARLVRHKRFGKCALNKNHEISVFGFHQEQTKKLRRQASDGARRGNEHTSSKRRSHNRAATTRRTPHINIKLASLPAPHEAQPTIQA